MTGIASFVDSLTSHKIICFKNQGKSGGRA